MLRKSRLAPIDDCRFRVGGVEARVRGRERTRALGVLGLHEQLLELGLEPPQLEVRTDRSRQSLLDEAAREHERVSEYLTPANLPATLGFY